MAIEEVFLAAVLQVLFQKLMSQDLLQYARREGLRPTLKKWERTLKTIESVLSDAEEKQLTDKSVKMWLDDLRDLAYDVEDILDEFATEALRRKLITGTADDDDQGSSSNKVRRVFTACFYGDWSPSGIKFNVRLGSKIKTISSRLDELCKQRAEFGLKEIVGRAPTRSADVYQRPPAACLPTEFAVYGRDEEKARVLEMVLRDEPSDANFGVVPIVGMGGLGKTTLARQVYKDEAVKDFNPKAWVCISDDFDVFRISKAILESITGKACDLNDLNQVQLQLKDALIGKKFLLILDDVWNKNYWLWETLRSPFMYGSPGSKIIVTTRSMEVASIMGSSDYCKLKLLSDDDCWSLFKKHAFQNKDINGRCNMELIRQKVVDKCRGLPLAARTLGGLLLSKQRDDEWDDIFNSGIWDLSDENEILPVLKLSYHHLPSHLKRCFAYTAILPKDFEFSRKYLVLLWMAEGLIPKQRDSKQLEKLGCEYFNELLSRSLYQESVGREPKYVMHDLVNDLAQWVARETSFRLEEEYEECKQPQISKKARHFSFISARYNGKAKFEVLHKVAGLRTILAISSSNQFYHPFYISNTAILDLFSKFKRLRALSLENYHIVKLPDLIGGLIHLRYLNLSGNKIRCLPESTTSLFNLETLILSYCNRLVKLPSNIQNMSNLQCLDIRGTNLVTEMPLGLKELQDLQMLSDFVVGKDGAGCALEGLKNLKFLQGELHISRLENVVDTQNAREGILSYKKGLKVLELEWDSKFDDSRNEVEEENVLNMLQPHTNLRSLTLDCYGGIRFPSWLGNASFTNMAVLRLQRCENCTLLPSLGLLSSLKELTIIGMKKLRSLASEFYGEGFLKPFQSLEILRFEDLQEWDSWETHVETFSCLQELSVINCPKLCGKLPDHLPSLERLEISKCEQLVVSLSSLPALCKLKVRGCKRIVWCSPSDSQSLKSITLSEISELGNWSLQEFQKVESLKIGGSEELIHLLLNEISLEKTPGELQAFNSIRKLAINCPNLVLFPEICFLPLLIELRILSCYALMSLPEGMRQRNVHLERLEISGNRSLSFVTRGQLPSSLKVLWLEGCEKLQYVFGDADETYTSSSVIHEENINGINTSLESLSVRSCPSLTCLTTRDRLPVTLKDLDVRECSEITTLSKGQLPDSLQLIVIFTCPKLESITERFHSSMLLETMHINNCESFELIPKCIHKLSRLRAKYLSSDGFQHLTSLVYLSIYNCPNLISFPKIGLPSSLMQLYINKCPMLEDRCRRDKGQEWSKVAHIPCVEINWKFIDDLEEKE